MHAHREPEAGPTVLAGRKHRVQPDQRFKAAGGSGMDRLRQPGRGRRQVHRRTHQVEQHRPVHGEGLRPPGERIGQLDRARQRSEQPRPVVAQAGVGAGTSCIPHAGLEERVERRLGVCGKAGGQGHVRRRDAVEHQAPYRRRELALQFQRSPRAIRRAHQVPALDAQLAAHRLHVLHRHRGGVVAQPVRPLHLGQALKPLAAGGHPFEHARGVGHRRQRLVAKLIAVQRGRSAGAALVDEHQVAPLVQAPEQGQHRGGQRDRALPRAAGEQQHRVGPLAPRHRRHEHVVHLDARAVGAGRIQWAAHAAAAQLLGDACHAARRRRGVRMHRQRAPQCPAKAGPPPSAAQQAGRQQAHAPSVPAIEQAPADEASPPSACRAPATPREPRVRNRGLARLP